LEIIFFCGGIGLLAAVNVSVNLHHYPLCMREIKMMFKAYKSVLKIIIVGCAMNLIAATSADAENHNRHDSEMNAHHSLKSGLDFPLQITDTVAVGYFPKSVNVFEKYNKKKYTFSPATGDITVIDGKTSQVFKNIQTVPTPIISRAMKRPARSMWRRPEISPIRQPPEQSSC
jgi:hypothetical protein